MRKQKRIVNIGGVKIGGDNPVAIQSMCNTDTRDVKATVNQIHELENAGCEIIRVAVPDIVAAKAVADIKKQIHIPLVVDIHFDYRLALECMKNGAYHFNQYKQYSSAVKCRYRKNIEYSEIYCQNCNQVKHIKPTVTARINRVVHFAYNSDRS